MGKMRENRLKLYVQVMRKYHSRQKGSGTAPGPALWGFCTRRLGDKNQLTGVYKEKKMNDNFLALEGPRNNQLSTGRDDAETVRVIKLNAEEKKEIKRQMKKWIG